MAYRETTAQRIREILQQKNADFYEKKMFAGICFMVDNKMCCATRIDKRTGEDVLLCRIGETAAVIALDKDHVIPMDFTGKTMKDFVYVTEGGHSKTKDLNYWLQLCLDFNPLAKTSGKK